MNNDPRQLVWFSCGAASAVCAKLCAEDPNTEIVYCKPGTAGSAGAEHPDNARFLEDVEGWTRQRVTVLENERYTGPMDVWMQTGFIAGPRGASCTRALKRKMREQYQEPDDVHVFGYTLDERGRAERFRERYPELTLRTPLIEEQLSKEDCLGLLWDAGIELPVMYRQGFNHNNCIGCPKGGMGYWNHVRKHYQERFEEAALIEREIGFAINKDADGPVFLDELDPERGRMQDEPDISCGIVCTSVAQSERFSE